MVEWFEIKNPKKKVTKESIGLTGQHRIKQRGANVLVSLGSFQQQGRMTRQSISYDWAARIAAHHGGSLGEYGFGRIKPINAGVL